MRLRRYFLLFSAMLLATMLLAACRPAAPRPTPVPPTAPPPTAIPSTPTPEGWAEHQTDALRIWLPADWTVINYGQGDFNALFEDLQKTNPDLATIIGSPAALEGAVFWAFRAARPDAVFTDNLNIRRSALNGQKIDTMQEVVDAVVGQYKTLGFEIVATQADLQIGGWPAASIMFSFPINTADGKTAAVKGYQYVVAGATDLWILSYSAGPDSEATLAPLFEQSARSFRVK